MPCPRTKQNDLAISVILVQCFLAGQVRVWSFEDGKCVFTKSAITTRKNENKNNNKEGDDQQIVYAALCENLGMIAVVTFDHNIVFHELESLKRVKQVWSGSRSRYRLVSKTFKM